MWQASFDISQGWLRLVLTDSGLDRIPYFVSAQQWPLSAGLTPVIAQLNQWEQDHCMKLQTVVCTQGTQDYASFRSLKRPSMLVSEQQADSMVNFWRTLALSPQWHRGVVLAMLGAHQRQGRPWKDDPESWVLTWMGRRLLEVEAFLYGDYERYPKRGVGASE